MLVSALHCCERAIKHQCKWRRPDTGSRVGPAALKMGVGELSVHWSSSASEWLLWGRGGG